jgi:hypothetical protein
MLLLDWLTNTQTLLEVTRRSVGFRRERNEDAQLLDPLDGRKASFLISFSYLPLLLLSLPADLMTRLQLAV